MAVLHIEVERYSATHSWTRHQMNVCSKLDAQTALSLQKGSWVTNKQETNYTDKPIWMV